MLAIAFLPFEQEIVDLVAPGERRVEGVRELAPDPGQRTVGDAGDYLALAASSLGDGWATPKTFRFGASGLLGDIVAVLGGQSAPSAPTSY